MYAQHIVSDFYTGKVHEETQININEISNTLCLIISLLSDQIYTKSTQ